MLRKRPRLSSFQATSLRPLKVLKQQASRDSCVLKDEAYLNVTIAFARKRLTLRQY
jgi:hypothetical protein